MPACNAPMMPLHYHQAPVQRCFTGMAAAAEPEPAGQYSPSPEIQRFSAADTISMYFLLHINAYYAIHSSALHVH